MINSTVKKWFAIAFPVMLVIAAVFAANMRTRLFDIDSGRFLIMGTFARIRLVCKSEQQGQETLNAARQTIDHIDKLMSTYRGDSELSEVNREAGKKPVRVSLETYNLLETALEYSRKTGGAFDITLAPLLKVWQEAEKQNRLPTANELAKAEELVGFEKLRLSAPKERTVSFAEEGMELNVNAITKGYAVDQVLAALRGPGVVAALVDIGGEIALSIDPSIDFARESLEKLKNNQN